MIDEDLNFVRKYNPRDDLGRYEWTIEYAKEQIDFFIESITVLDRKTENLMRYFGGIAIGMIALFPFLFKDNFGLVLFFLPSLALLIFGAMKAAYTVAPQDFPTLPSIKKAFEYSDYFDKEAMIRFYVTMVALEGELKELMYIKDVSYRCALKFLWGAIWWSVFVIAVISYMVLRGGSFDFF